MPGSRIGSPARPTCPTGSTRCSAVVYLIFNEGYTASLRRSAGARRPVRRGHPARPAAARSDARRARGDGAARADAAGRVAPRRPHSPRAAIWCCSADQDRSLWNADLIVEGQAIVRRCLQLNRPGPYQIQAAINAVHSERGSAEATDWWQILQLYDQLLAIAPTPVVALNRAVAVAEVDGPEAALGVVDELDLGDYYLYHAVRADLLRRAGRPAEAAEAYAAAIQRSDNETERVFLQRRRDALANA